MMRKGGRETTAVFTEWESLAFDRDLPESEKRERWSKLYRDSRADDGWSVSFDDAMIIADLGIRITLESHEWQQARDLARQLFAHPDFPKKSYTDVDFVHFWIRLWLIEILCDNVDLGIINLCQPLKGKGRPPRTYLLTLRSQLQDLLHLLDEATEIDTRIAVMVGEVIGRFSGCKKKARMALQAQTYSELNELVGETYPPGPDL